MRKYLTNTIISVISLFEYNTFISVDLSGFADIGHICTKLAEFKVPSLLRLIQSSHLRLVNILIDDIQYFLDSEYGYIVKVYCREHSYVCQYKSLKHGQVLQRDQAACQYSFIRSRVGIYLACPSQSSKSSTLGIGYGSGFVTQFRHL